MRIRRGMEGIFVVIAVLLFFSITNAEECYKWVDDKGVINFTDSLDVVPEQYKSRVKPCEATSEPGLNIEKVTPESGPETAQSQDLFGRTREYWVNRVAEARERLRQAQDEYERLRIEYRNVFWKQQEATTTTTDALDEYAKRKKSLKAQMTQQALEIDNAQEYLDVTLPKEAEEAGAPPEWLQ